MRSLKLVRLIRGKSQFDISLKTGIPNYRLSVLENGKADPSEDELAKLALVLATTPEILSREICHEQLLVAKSRNGMEK